ncbi:conserved hypothetical protein [Uncinocarpus reesii 1704]|uniref:mRNA N(6)-methyladenine demethylase n=1 Tax=Uncinocarpus reesii (strain UAMH 1704) TaxID=336963 RepID=C4JG19_UNCRE|nr:uncharacterized protein UREG_01099 [Uncinocarpus reesii 1704]EEP76250.1 conserved hypothetical protein [Uncinocarpus reesii 1704]
MGPTGQLNPHERAPAAIRELYNECRRLSPSQIDSHPRILDFKGLDEDHLPNGVILEKRIPKSTLESASPDHLVPVAARVQVELFSRLLHRDLSDESHQTNLHLHYNVSYPAVACCPFETERATENLQQKIPGTGKPSFFQDDPTRLLSPKDPSIHRPLSIQAALNSKLRWMTLGGQYNWTSKEYPPGPPPPFPSDIGILLHSIFQETTAEAAIVNLYSPGDTLYPHRDVSEECDQGLISISLGCDGLFLVGHENEECTVLRLRSGDAVYMSGASRFAWHAVPKIIPATCPESLEAWPGGGRSDGDGDALDHWRGWMAGKRINLNVRQMFKDAGTDRKDDCHASG